MHTPPPESSLPANPAPADLAGTTANDIEEKNGVVFYRGARPFEELEFPPETADYEWALHDPQVQREYSGKVVAVRGRKVWGAGKNARAAWEEASKVAGCPPLDELLFVVVPGPAVVAGGGNP
jgi:hypothetical protein